MTYKDTPYYVPFASIQLLTTVRYVNLDELIYSQKLYYIHLLESIQFAGTAKDKLMKDYLTELHKAISEIANGQWSAKWQQEYVVDTPVAISGKDKTSLGMKHNLSVIRCHAVSLWVEANALVPWSILDFPASIQTPLFWPSSFDGNIHDTETIDYGKLHPNYGQQDAEWIHFTDAPPGLLAESSIVCEPWNNQVPVASVEEAANYEDNAAKTGKNHQCYVPVDPTTFMSALGHPYCAGLWHEPKKHYDVGMAIVGLLDKTALAGLGTAQQAKLIIAKAIDYFAWALFASYDMAEFYSSADKNVFKCNAARFAYASSAPGWSRTASLGEMVDFRRQSASAWQLDTLSPAIGENYFESGMDIHMTGVAYSQLLERGVFCPIPGWAYDYCARAIQLALRAVNMPLLDVPLRVGWCRRLIRPVDPITKSVLFSPGHGMSPVVFEASALYSPCADVAFVPKIDVACESGRMLNAWQKIMDRSLLVEIGNSDSFNGGLKGMLPVLWLYGRMRRGILNLLDVPYGAAAASVFSDDAVMGICSDGCVSFADLDSAVESGTFVPEDGIPIGLGSLMKIFKFLGVLE